MLNIKQNNQFSLVTKFSDESNGVIAQHTRLQKSIVHVKRGHEWGV